MKKLLTGIVVVGIIIASIIAFRSQGTYYVTEVFDGDTISVDMSGVVEKVRLIGVDAPETKDPRKPVQCYGPEASAFTHSKLDHAKVTLRADPLSTNRDRYNRLLRYVYTENGSSYNKLLLQKGFARAYTGFPFSKMSQFKETAATAEANKTGLWATCPNI